MRNSLADIPGSETLATFVPRMHAVLLPKSPEGAGSPFVNSSGIHLRHRLL